MMSTGMSAPWMKEYRCTHCGKLMFKGVLVDSAVEIKCKGCNALVTLNGEAKEALLCLASSCPHRVSVSSIER